MGNFLISGFVLAVRFKYQSSGSQRAGQLQVHADDRWWAVCDTDFTDKEARVACR